MKQPLICVVEKDTEFYPGKTIYRVKISIKNKEQHIPVTVDYLQNKIYCDKEVNPGLAEYASSFIRNYLAALQVLSDY